MSLKLYVDLMSQPSRAVWMLLKLTNIPFESCLVKLREGEHLGEYFGKVNRLRKVPVIDDEGFILTESVAILRYLAKSKNIPDYWYPSDPKLQARVDEYLEWQHLNTRLFCAMFFRHKFLEPMLSQKPPKEEAVARFYKEMEKCLDQIQTIWLDNGNKKFIAGDHISVADLLACCEMEQPSMAGYDVFAKYPILAAYRERVKEITQPHYEDAHKVVRLMVKKFNGVPQLNKL